MAMRIDARKGGLMRRTTTLCVMLVAVFAVSAVAAGTAAAEKLEIYEIYTGSETALGMNETFDAYVSNGAFEGGTATFEGNPGWGTITCNSPYLASGWGGLVKTNDKATDELELVSDHGAFAGEEECSNSSGLGASATAVFNPDAAKLSLTATGKATVTARYSSEPITLKVAYSGGDVCNYSAVKLAGTAELRSWEGSGYDNIAVSLSKQPLSLAAGSARECSKKEFVSVLFGFEGTRGGYPNWGEGYFVFGKDVS